MKKAPKVLLTIVITLLLLIGAFSLFAYTYLNDTLKPVMIEEFERQTDQEYTLDFSGITINLLGRSVTVDSVAIQPNSDQQPIQKISAASISVQEIKWFSFFNNPFPHFGAIVVDRPYVEAIRPKITGQSFSKTKAPANSAASDIPTFNFIIKNGGGKLIKPNKQEVASIADISLKAEDVDIQEILNGSELVFLDKLDVQAKGIQWLLEDKLYELKADAFNFEKATQKAVFKNFKLNPLAPKYRFSEIRGHQLDRMELSIPQITATGIELDSLSHNRLDINRLTVSGAKLHVFRDKYKDRPEGVNEKPLFYDLAAATDFSFELKEADISNSTVIYEEHQPPAKETGSISFNRIDATVKNFRSKAHPKFQEDSLLLNVEALFMDAAPLKLDIGYALFDSLNTHTVDLTVGSFNPKIASDIIENVGFIRIEDGMVDDLHARYTLDNTSAKGAVLVRYRDLKISILDKENPDKSSLRQKFGDFIANTFVINSNNTGDKAQPGPIDYERDIEKSIFAYWWKAIFDGIKNTVK